MSYQFGHVDREERIERVKDMHTLNLICTVVKDEDDAVSWLMTFVEIEALADIRALPGQGGYFA